jgi:hypothetical protein
VGVRRRSPSPRIPLAAGSLVVLILVADLSPGLSLFLTNLPDPGD